MKMISNAIFEGELSKLLFHNYLNFKEPFKFRKHIEDGKIAWVSVIGFIPLEFLDMIYSKRNEIGIIPNEESVGYSIFKNPREFLSHRRFDVTEMSLQASRLNKSYSDVYKSFCDIVISKDYQGCYVEMCNLYSCEELRFFIKNFIQYIDSKRITNLNPNSENNATITLNL